MLLYKQLLLITFGTALVDYILLVAKCERDGRGLMQAY